jgi:hypothetical protein
MAGDPREDEVEERVGLECRKRHVWRGGARVGIAGLLLLLGATGHAEELSLAATIAAAPGGVANGHNFTHLVPLDPANTYTGGALIQDDTCIRGNGATIDLEPAWIMVTIGAGATRFDIDHALILNGGNLGSDYGGGIEFGPGTQGWVINNTFYDNYPYGIYLHEVDLDDEAVRIELNILYQNGVAGLVINDAQLGFLQISYNDSNGNLADYAMHCGCGSEAVVEIIPGETPGEGGAPALDGSNLTADPLFVLVPGGHGVPPDYHLKEGSPCIGAGPFGEDLGAFPYHDSPVVPTTWGALKSLFRE